MAYASGWNNVPPPTYLGNSCGGLPVLWSVMRSVPLAGFFSIRSIAPRSRTPLSSTLRRWCSPGRAIHPRQSETEFEVRGHPAVVHGGDLLDPTAPDRCASLRFRCATTRGMAGASFSSFSAATRSSTRSAISITRAAFCLRIGSSCADCNFAEQAELGSVEQRAASERIHLFQRDLLLARPQAMDGMQQKAIRASSVMLQRRWRIGRAASRWVASTAAWRRPVRRCHPPRTSRCGSAGRSGAGLGQKIVSSDQVVARAFGILRIRFKGAAQRGQIEFRIVDGFRRLRRAGQSRREGAPWRACSRTYAGRAGDHMPRRTISSA